MPSILCMYDANPEIRASLMHPDRDFHGLPVGLFVGDDCEVIGALIFSTRGWCIPDQAFQPLIVDEASVLWDCTLVDSWIHVYRLECTFPRKPHLLFPLI